MILYSLIIPTLEASAALTEKAFRITQSQNNAEVIIVQAEAEGVGTHYWQERVCFVKASKGRGRQMNAGSKLAQGKILIFLHADTSLPSEAFEALGRFFENPAHQIACFRLRFDDAHFILRFYEFWARFDSVLTSFGDQAIAVRARFFKELNGFADWPLFEDVDLFQRARKITKIRKLPCYVQTSAVRYRQNGMIRQQIKNAYLLMQYLRGVSPWELVKSYDKKS